MSQSVLAKSASGSIYNISVSAVTMVLGFVRSVLLMRLLPDPDYFGIISLSLFFTTIWTPFSVLGLDSALLQKKDSTESSFSTHFVLRVSLACLMIVTGLAISPILRKIYSNSSIMVNIFIILLVLNLLEASYSTPGVILKRELRFGSIAALNLTASIAMTITAPLLAFWGAGIWSLVAEQVIGPMVRWIGIWVIMHPWKPSFKFDWQDAKSSISFGSNLLASNLLGILLDRFDDFWTGTYLGPTALGYYSRAYDLAQYPERILATPITNVFFLTYAAVQDNTKLLSKAFFRSSSFLIRVGLFFAVILIFTAPEITVIFYTDDWLPIVPIFRLMLIYIILDPFYVNLSYLMIGVGRPSILTQIRLIQAVVFIIAVITLASLFGVKGVALAANLMMFIGTIILTIRSRQFIQISYKRMFFWPLVAATLSTIAGMGSLVYTQGFSLLPSLIFKAGIITSSYGLILYLTERQIIHEYTFLVIKPLLNKIKKYFR